MLLGAKHVESPYIEIGQIATVFYFSYFIVILPLSSLFENSINEFYTQVKENKEHNTMKKVYLETGITWNKISILFFYLWLFF